MIGLTADSDQADGPRRVLLADLGESLGDLSDRHVPGDPFEGAVVAAAQRMLDALGVILVVGDGESLVADVALGDGIRRIRPHVRDPPFFDVDANAAVVTA